jgi:hypothetical protein
MFYCLKQALTPVTFQIAFFPIPANGQKPGKLQNSKKTGVYVL